MFWGGQRYWLEIEPTRLLLTVQLVNVSEPELNRPPPRPAEVEPRLPLTVQLFSVAVPLLDRPPPYSAKPPVIVIPEIDTVTKASTWNTRLAPPPLTVTPAAGPVIVAVPI